MNKKVVWGIILVIIGVAFLLHTFGVIDLENLRNGWWTWFIIIPCFCNLFIDKNKVGSIIGLGMGILLLLASRGCIDWSMMWNIGFAFVIIMIGVNMIFSNRNNKVAKVEVKDVNRDGKNIKQYNVSFGSQTVSFDGQVFEGADIKCSFGACKIDLRQAIITEDVVIKVNCSFGGIEIWAPNNLEVKVAARSSFGGVEDDRKGVTITNDSKALYIDGEISFAGVAIK